MPSELDQQWESAASSAPMVHGSACVIEIWIISIYCCQKCTVKIIKIISSSLIPRPPCPATKAGCASKAGMEAWERG